MVGIMCKLSFEICNFCIHCRSFAEIKLPKKRSKWSTKIEMSRNEIKYMWSSNCLKLNHFICWYAAPSLQQYHQARIASLLHLSDPMVYSRHITALPTIVGSLWRWKMLPHLLFETYRMVVIVEWKLALGCVVWWWFRNESVTKAWYMHVLWS